MLPWKVLGNSVAFAQLRWPAVLSLQLNPTCHGLCVHMTFSLLSVSQSLTASCKDNSHVDGGRPPQTQDEVILQSLTNYTCKHPSSK